jgi:cytochrome c oxidase cbb3-type subunit 3
MKSNKLLKPLLSILLLFTLSSPLLAESGNGEGTNLETVLKVMIAVTAFTIAFVLWLVLVYAEKNDAEGEMFLGPLKAALHWFTKSTPISKESEILMAHDYDGIRELDNKIPPWFNFLFYGTILFSIVYMIHYHVIGSGNIQVEEYQEEMSIAKAQQQLLMRSGALLDEESVTKLNDAPSLSNGKDIYVQHCAACHANDGGGLVGPNFTDDYWIHGGGIKNVFETIKYGVPQKGMISWQTQLSPTEMQEVGSYILTLQGTTPAVPKVPEGELWTPSDEEKAEEAANPALTDKGIGAITDVSLGEIDPQLVSKGSELFVNKCSACHKLDKRFVGPPLRGITERRTPEWIMNMILDPDKMVKGNKAAKELLEEYISPMANQSLTQDEARAILEYFRTETSLE